MIRTLFEAYADVRAESKNGNTDLAAATHFVTSVRTDWMRRWIQGH